MSNNFKKNLIKLYNRFKSSLLFASATFIVQAINAITLPIFTRILTQADYGIISSTNSVQNFTTAVFRLGTQQAVLKQYKDYNDNEKKQYLFSVILFSLLWGILLFSVFIFIDFITGIELFENVDFYPFISITILTSAFSTSYALFQSYLRILNISKVFIALAVILVLLNVTISLLLIIYYDLGALGKLLGGLLPYLLIFVYIAFKTFSKFKIKYWIDAIRFGYPLAISSLIFTIIMLYTISYISWQVSLDELGVYHIGRNLGLLIPDFLFQSLILTYQPFIYNKLREKNLASITRYNSIVIAGLILAVLIVSILGKYVILIFTTADYLGALTLMRLFLISYIFKVIYYYPMISLFYRSKTFLYTKIELSSLGIFLIFIHFFVPWLSIEGVGVAFIIQEFVKMILIVFFSKLRLSQIFNIRKLSNYE